MKHPPPTLEQSDATYEDLRARLPEEAHPGFDRMVDQGWPIEEIAECVRRYLEFWDDVPDEVHDGLDRMNAAAESIEDLPATERARLADEFFMVKRAGDFTAARHRQFMWQAHGARMRVRRPVAAPARAACTPTLAAPRRRREGSSSRTSGQDPGGDDDPDPPGDRLALLLVDEEPPAAQTPPRYCRCERDRPFTAPNWDIGPDGGDCRSCTLGLRPRDVRFMHAIARSERAGWLR